MSVIYPRTYRLIAEELAQAYAKVRDAIWQDGASYDSSALGDVINISEYQAGNSDITFDGSQPPQEVDVEPALPSSAIFPSDSSFSDWVGSSGFTAPEGSIAKDMGTALFTLTNSTISLSNARAVAGRLFGTYLRALNSHVTSRMYNVTSINSYYQAYGFISDSSSNINYEDNLNLFDSDPGTSGNQSSYFSADFVELSEQIGVVIDDEFRA